MLLELKKFYKNKKILITGNTGFKGSWLTLFLISLNSNILGCSISELKNPNLYKVLKLNKKIKFIKEDIRNFNKLKKIFDKFKPQVIFHLAAQSLVRKSLKSPLYTVSTNVHGSANILECCRLSKSVKSLIYVTSDKCYENYGWTWGYRENDRLGGHDPYSSSKAAAENLFASYLESYFKKKKIGAASVRAGNIIGGGDWSQDRLFPDMVRSITSKKKLLVRNPNATRPWQHILDPLYGYLILGMKIFNKNTFSGSWNFGPQTINTFPVKKIVSLAAPRLNIKKKNIIYNKQKKNEFMEAKFLKLNCDKANYYLKWKPCLTVRESIIFTIDWYKYYFQRGKKNLYQFTLNQINYYLDKMKKK